MGADSTNIWQLVVESNQSPIKRLCKMIKKVFQHNIFGSLSTSFLLKFISFLCSACNTDVVINA